MPETFIIQNKTYPVCAHKIIHDQEVIRRIREYGYHVLLDEQSDWCDTDLPIQINSNFKELYSHGTLLSISSNSDALFENTFVPDLFEMDLPKNHWLIFEKEVIHYLEARAITIEQASLYCYAIELPEDRDDHEYLRAIGTRLTLLSPDEYKEIKREYDQRWSTYILSTKEGKEAVEKEDQERMSNYNMCKKVRKNR